MLIERDKILAFLAGRSCQANAEHAAGILCSGPGGGLPVRVIDDAETEPDDGPSETPKIAPCRPAGGPPVMIELPAHMFNEPWIRQSMQARIGRAGCDAFHARMSDLGQAACEPAYLSLVLREVYGPEAARALMDAAVFSQPAYGPLKKDVGPVLEEYVYR